MSDHPYMPRDASYLQKLRDEPSGRPKMLEGFPRLIEAERQRLARRPKPEGWALLAAAERERIRRSKGRGP